MAHGFDVVPSWADDERRVMAGAVLRARARWRWAGFSWVSCKHSETVPFGWLSSTPFGGHSLTSVMPSASKARTKKVRLAAKSLTPNFT
jgi:hypothetical protein